MRLIKYIIVHTSAGFSLIPDIESYWYRPKSKGGLGWKNPGYHIIIYEDGTMWYVTKDGSYSTNQDLWYPQLITNGVKDFNSTSIHICYIGGINKETKKGEDTRTEEQKDSLLKAFGVTYTFLKQHQGVEGILLRGHRDFSPDKNKNGELEDSEWLKSCPCFDVLDEYWWVQGTEAINKGRMVFA